MPFVIIFSGMGIEEEEKRNVGTQGEDKKKILL